jgi:hypothetical protein
LHTPEVECIGNGTARKTFEFGVKVSLVVTHLPGATVGAGSSPAPRSTATPWPRSESNHGPHDLCVRVRQDHLRVHYRSRNTSSSVTADA